jgi:hypothetical protein
LSPEETSHAVTTPLSPSPLAVDKVSIYGLSFDFPFGAKLEFNPKLTREDGGVAVKPSRDSVVFVTWGPLDKIPKRADEAEDHANFNLGRIEDRTRRRLTTLEHKVQRTNGHDSVYNAVLLEPTGGVLGWGKREEETVRSLHIHCETSGRYFVVYCVTNKKKGDQQSLTLETVINSFRCH